MKFKFSKFRKSSEGFSLIEILIVLAVFTVLAILVTQVIFRSIRGSKKSESLSHVRDNLDYALNSMEKNLRNAKEITNCTASTITYTDVFGNTGKTYACMNLGIDGNIASSSARLTSTDVKITSCSFTCSYSVAGRPDYIDLVITATDAKASGVESAQVTTQTRIMLRNY